MTVILNTDRFGQNLRTRRMKRKISQKALAKHCGISVYRVRCLEQGRIREVEVHLLRELCHALDCAIEDLVHPDAG